MTRAQVAGVCELFWHKAGGGDGFPRDIELAAVLTPDVTVECVRGLTSRHAVERLPGVTVPPGTDRDLLGCCVATRGHALLLVESALAADLRRAVVAHELGHYLGEYKWPRDRAVARLGATVVPVLDGDRPPTAADGWAALLAGVRLGPHAHYLGRGYTGPGDDHHPAERLANDFALELLAPHDRAAAIPGREDDRARAFEQAFGLPADWARNYARRLARAAADRERAGRAFGL